MDIIKLKSRISDAVGKYKYVWIVLAAGMVLMMIPGKSDQTAHKEAQQSDFAAEESSMEDQLEEILGQIDGAGEVKVMLGVAQGERIVYQTDSTHSQSDADTDTRTQTILVTDSERNETGLVHKIDPPVYRGAIVLAHGADNSTVRLAIVNAVSNVTGLGADKISVVKMR